MTKLSVLSDFNRITQTTCFPTSDWMANTNVSTAKRVLLIVQPSEKSLLLIQQKFCKTWVITVSPWTFCTVILTNRAQSCKNWFATVHFLQSERIWLLNFTDCGKSKEKTLRNKREKSPSSNTTSQNFWRKTVESVSSLTFFYCQVSNGTVHFSQSKEFGCQTFTDCSKRQICLLPVIQLLIHWAFLSLQKNMFLSFF